MMDERKIADTALERAKVEYPQANDLQLSHHAQLLLQRAIARLMETRGRHR